MSVSASIALTLKETVSPSKIITMLLEYGWAVSDHGKMAYLPIEDNDEFNWIWEEINLSKLFDIINEKEKKGELIGIIISWRNTNIGGALLLWKDGKISLSLDVNRQVTQVGATHPITDVTWYLMKLCPAFNKTHQTIELIEYSEQS